MLGNKEKDKIVKRYGDYYWEQIKKLSESYDKDIEERAREIEGKDKRIGELEQELAELKQKAIVPKFKIGQECYLIDNNFNYFKNTKEFNIVCSNIKKQQNWYYVKDYGVYHENDLFATEQEAQEKLKEIQGNG